MDGMVWAVALLAVGLVVMVLEVFVPSGGVLGFVSIVAIVAGVVTAFNEAGLLAGLSLLATAVVLVPFVLLAAFHWFPVTPLGRRVLPDPPEPEDVLPARGRREALRALVGRRGIVASELVPWGQVVVGDSRVEALSIEGPLGEGLIVTVVGIDGMGVTVRRAEEPPPAPAASRPPAPSVDPPPPGPESASGAVAAPAGESRLSRTLEEFDFSDLDSRPEA
jgi:membrane-bound ClpP family serine protease